MAFLNPTYLLAILLAVTIHEWAHAASAARLGDPTAANQGRLTLNPLAHLDPLGTLLFLTIGFGWGKPVPINPAYFSHPKRDTAVTALAGPFSNLVLAILAFASLQLLNIHTGTNPESLLTVSATGPEAAITSFLSAFLFINLGLMAFNLLPIAPLDGSKIIGAFIPTRYDYEYESYLEKGPYILLGLLLAERIFNFPFLIGWIELVMSPILQLMSLVGG